MGKSPSSFEGSTLQVAGKIAGLAGLALAVFLIIFQGVIQFSLRGASALLTPSIAFAITTSLMCFTFGIAAIGIVAYLIGKPTPKSPVPPPIIFALCILIVAVLAISALVGTLSVDRVIKGSPTPEPSLTTATTEFNVCIGEYPEHCPPGAVHLYCGSSVEAWATSQCAKFSATRLSDISGNKCGYYTARVTCQKRM